MQKGEGKNARRSVIALAERKSSSFNWFNAHKMLGFSIHDERKGDLFMHQILIYSYGSHTLLEEKSSN
jgi:cold shock CspA family protein